MQRRPLIVIGVVVRARFVNIDLIDDESEGRV